MISINSALPLIRGAEPLTYGRGLAIPTDVAARTAIETEEAEFLQHLDGNSAQRFCFWPLYCFAGIE
ncbi:MAG TPA: hypothetical protein VFW25_13265 [Silvibacterium sp.]|nr:hypothetical protein [Silvibacterium sp.]